MTNSMCNPQPNYSGVTIQIVNPAVNVNPHAVKAGIPQGISVQSGYANTYPVNSYYTVPQEIGSPAAQKALPVNTVETAQKPLVQPQNFEQNTQIYTNPQPNRDFPQTYPAEYYIKNYAGKQEFTIPQGVKESDTHNANADKYASNPINNNPEQNQNISKNNPFAQQVQNNQETIDPNTGLSPYRDLANQPEIKQPSQMIASGNIISELDERNAQIKEAEKNTKEQKIIALTDDYIKSLENYLNNPDNEVRLMASKEILKRLDEDHDRYDDAALNALLNKMLQDPSKLIRIAALSAFASQLACGNDYTVKLLKDIQSNPNADKEDALQAADILLKMSAGTEVKNVPIKESENKQKG